MSHHDILVIAGKALGMFSYMVWEQALGRTKYGGTLGLAKAIGRAILGALLNRIFNRGAGAPQTGKEPNK